MQVNKVTHPKFTSNSWIVSIGKNCIIFDCNHLLEKYLVENQLTPLAIFLTHEHFDHIEGLNALRSKYKLKVYASSSVSEAIGDERQNLSLYYYGKGYLVDKADVIVNNGDIINIQGYDIHCLSTKGHTQGGMVYFLDKYVFTGDTFMQGIKTPTNLPGGNKEELAISLKLISGQFDESYLFCCGH